MDEGGGVPCTGLLRDLGIKCIVLGSGRGQDHLAKIVLIPCSYLAAWEFQYAAKLMPDRFEPLNNLGLIYESVGKYDEAITFYIQARERATTDPEVVGNLARASIRSGQTVDEARPMLEDVLAVDPRPEWVCWAGGTAGYSSCQSQ